MFPTHDEETVMNGAPERVAAPKILGPDSSVGSGVLFALLFRRHDTNLLGLSVGRSNCAGHLDQS